MKKQPIIVIKLGTSSIVHEKTHQPLLSTLALIVETCVSLRLNGYRIVLVSSGAIGISLQKMGLARRPKHLPKVQALAAIGQCRLMGLWEEMFERLGQPIAQILLTRNDIADRIQYLNAQNTFTELLNMGVIPIVNENDTLAVTEIKFGDNDTLSAITAGMVGADYLFLMTDVDCLYDKNPRTHADARPIEVVENILELAVDVSSAGSALGTGGMGTKIVAARLATAAGVTTIITRSSLPGNVSAIVRYLEGRKPMQRLSGSTKPGVEGDGPVPAPPHSEVQIQPPPLHTRFLPLNHRIRDRHFWLLHGLTPHGTIYIDHGAARALSEGRGLLPVGIIDVDGSFAQQECVRIVESARAPKQAMHAAGPSFVAVGSSTPSTGTSAHRTSLPTPTSLSSFAFASFDFPDTTSSAASTTADGAAAASGASTPLSQSQTLPHLAHSGPSREVGRALVNYSAVETRRIAGLQSAEISGVLGYADTQYVAFRENVALFHEVRTGGSGAANGGESRSESETPEWSPGGSETSTLVPGTPSAGREGVGMGLGGYVEG